MRPGPARGDTATMTVTVTADMTARITGREIHPVYGTVALVGHIEQLCRELLEPHLGPDEDGVGYRIEATHHAPAPVGATLVLTATVADVGPRRLLCEVAVRHGSRLVAHGAFEQRIVSAADFAATVAGLADVTASPEAGR